MANHKKIQGESRSGRNEWNVDFLFVFHGKIVCLILFEFECWRELEEYQYGWIDS